MNEPPQWQCSSQNSFKIKVELAGFAAQIDLLLVPKFCESLLDLTFDVAASEPAPRAVSAVSVTANGFG